MNKKEWKQIEEVVVSIILHIVNGGIAECENNNINEICFVENEDLKYYNFDVQGKYLISIIHTINNKNSFEYSLEFLSKIKLYKLQEVENLALKMLVKKE